MSHKVKPLYDRVLVRRLESEQKTPGGLYIPDTAQEKTYIASVIATGEGRQAKDGSLRPLKVKAGDKILFGKYAGTEIKVDGDEFLILKEDEILGVVE